MVLTTCGKTSLPVASLMALVACSVLGVVLWAMPGGDAPDAPDLPQITWPILAGRWQQDSSQIDRMPAPQDQREIMLARAGVLRGTRIECGPDQMRIVNPSGNIIAEASVVTEVGDQNTPRVVLSPEPVALGSPLVLTWFAQVGSEPCLSIKSPKLAAPVIFRRIPAE